VSIGRLPRTVEDIDPTWTGPPARGLRFKVRKPRLPWRYAPRTKEGGLVQGCGNRSIRWGRFPSAQEVEQWRVKNCLPRQAIREFNPGGPESGTLAGARRAPGLFDSNWGTPFPLTRREQRALQEGQAVPDPLFAPPTTPNPGNWIDDKLRRIRGTFGPTQFQTPKSYLRFCPEGGFLISCAGPDFAVEWYGGSVKLTPSQVEDFNEAYCRPQQCGLGRRIPPPPGYKEFYRVSKPRNAAVLLKASCQRVPEPGPVVMDVPLPPIPPAPAAPAPAISTSGCPPGWGLCRTQVGIGCYPLSMCMFPATQAEFDALITGG
jgi:hypothetical protein